MTFKDFEYQRITLAQIEAFYQEKLPLLKEAADTATFMQLFNEINQYRGHVMTMATLCSIRHSIDTADQFYDQENDYWDALLPNVQVYETEFMAACLDTPLKEELPIPATFFKLAENARRAFSPAIVADLQEENRLSSEYDKLKASAKIVYDGVTYNLASIAPKLMDPSRQVRKEAFDAVCAFYAENEERFDELYDQFLSVRDLGEGRRRHYEVLRRMIHRYESYIRCSTGRKRYAFDLLKVNKDVLDSLYDSIENKTCM